MISLFVYDAQITKELTIDSVTSTVSDLYNAVAGLYGHLKSPTKHLRLLFTDKELPFSEKRKRISCFGIVNHSTIGVVRRLPDGCLATQKVAVDTKTPTETLKSDAGKFRGEKTTMERNEMNAETENEDKKEVVCDEVIGEIVTEERRKEDNNKKKKNKKKKRKTKKNQFELENVSIDKNMVNENGEDENMNKIADDHLRKEEMKNDNNEEIEPNVIEKNSKKRVKKKGRKEKTQKIEENEKNEKEECDRPQLQRIPGIIQITDDNDFNECSPSAKLPCGHLISSESMRMHCEFEVGKGKLKISCATCKVDLDYRHVRHIACFTTAEIHSLEKDILQNFLGKDKDVFPCPGCEAWTSSSNRHSDCLECFSCSERTGNKFLFCRNCFHKWGNPSDNRCTNLTCKFYIEPALKILRESQILFPFNSPLFLRWSILQHRVCPRCGLLMKFSGGCTQVHCDFCSYYYCFVCLKGAESKGELKCLPYYSNCLLAPVQTVIPVWTPK